MKIFKKLMLVLTSIVVLLILVVAGYVIYMSIQYYRLDEVVELNNDIENPQSQELALNTKYTIATYNIGFGAYNREYSFFMDEGVMLDGTKVVGKSAKAASYETVIENTTGSINIAKSFNPDFMLFQEVDILATRSYKYNQYEAIKDAFSDYASIFSHNFHSAFLFYPLTDPHGAVEAGIVTLSKYNLSSATRYKLPIDESFPNKFFDLDRCFMTTRTPINGGKELVIINVHLSAYDEGGIFRKAQFDLLKEIMISEYEKGSYVIVGGDFNHDIASSLNTFPTQQRIPEWVYVLDASILPSGFSFSASNKNPSCRSADIPYEEGINYTVTIDGFIISDNIEEISINNITTLDGEDINFLYSDHNCVVLEFELK